MGSNAMTSSRLVGKKYVVACDGEFVEYFCIFPANMFRDLDGTSYEHIYTITNPSAEQRHGLR